MSRRTEMAYKAQSPGKLAPFDFAQGVLSPSKETRMRGFGGRGREKLPFTRLGD
jgi:hypothetical protein